MATKGGDSTSRVDSLRETIWSRVSGSESATWAICGFLFAHRALVPTLILGSTVNTVVGHFGSVTGLTQHHLEPEDEDRP